MDESNKPGTEVIPPAVAPPAVTPTKAFSMDEVKSFVQAQVSEALTKQRIELEQKFVADNAALRLHMEAEQARAYSLAVDSFVGKIADGKATPAFQKVVRCGLIGNKDVSISYYNNEKKEFEPISLQVFVDKIAATADFDNISNGNGETREVGADGKVKKNSDPKVDKKVFSSDDVKAMANDPAKFAAFMKDHSIPNFKSTAASGANGTGKPQA